MPNSLKIAFKNQSSSSTVYAYVTGLALQNNSQWVLLQSDGKTLYYPKSPSTTGSPLTEDVAIPLGAPGNTVTITIPQIAGGRVFFSIGAKLTFLLNPGPALVEPSVTNPSDPNININWGFCEFTLNNDQLFANISYVDFVSNVPIALTLQDSAGGVQHVSGTPANGLNAICAALTAQTGKDGQPWDKLIVQHNGANLRALSPNQGLVMNASYFNGYYEPYVDQVWQKYRAGKDFTINTQSSYGILNGTINSSNQLVIGGRPFSKPSTRDIFSCNSGPLLTGPSAETNVIIPRLAAAFVRSTLLSQTVQPSSPSTFYEVSPTNHYARIVHAHNVDSSGYAFPYDDVTADGDADQSGKVNSGNPTLWTISVGGNAAYAGNKLDTGHHNGGHTELKREEHGPDDASTPHAGGGEGRHGSGLKDLKGFAKNFFNKG